MFLEFKKNINTVIKREIEYIHEMGDRATEKYEIIIHTRMFEKSLNNILRFEKMIKTNKSTTKLIKLYLYEITNREQLSILRIKSTALV